PSRMPWTGLARRVGLKVRTRRRGRPGTTPDRRLCRLRWSWCVDNARSFCDPRLSIVILETIITTVADDGAGNFAPMGVEWGEEAIVLKPFLETATYRNVMATRAAVVNLTDDVRVFARAAISNPQYPTRPAALVRGVVLADGCSWREIEVRSIDST